VSQSDRRAAAKTVVEGPEDWQMGNAGEEVAATAAGGAAEDGPGAAAEAAAGRAAGVRPPRPENWEKFDEKPTKTLERARREATSKFRSRWDLNITWGPAEQLQRTTVGSEDPLSLHRR